MINKKIFKAYDIRGIYPTEIDEEAAYEIGRAFVFLTKSKRMVIGRDMRFASPALLEKFVKGALSRGANVDSIGCVPVDAVYYALWSNTKYDAGVYVTASHNPKEYHGFKMFQQDGKAVKGEDIKKIFFPSPFIPLPQRETETLFSSSSSPATAEEGRVSSSPHTAAAGNGQASSSSPIAGKSQASSSSPLGEEGWASSSPSPLAEEGWGEGEYHEIDIFDNYIQYLLSFVDMKNIKPLRVVVDAGNGMAGKAIPELEKYLPIFVTRLFFELDGSFPNHPSNPLEPQSQVVLREKVIETQADFGVIFDGDTDRLFFIDEKGNLIQADITLLILARYFLEKYPGAGVVYNAICSRSVPELVEKWGGRTYCSKVGFVNIKEMMIQHKAMIGGEVSAHYNFRDNFYSDSGLIAFLIMLEILSGETRMLSDIAKELKMYSRGDEINLRLENIPEKIQAVKKRYKDGTFDTLDGVTVYYPDYWFNVRPSNTEPLVRVTVEAKTSELLKEKTKELIEFLTSSE